MTSNLLNLDANLVGNWERAYSSVKSDETLWGKEPIPFIKEICTTFSSISAKRVLDFPCGDGRNAIYLAEYFDEVVSADSSTSALKMLFNETSQKNVKNIIQVKSNLFDSCFIDDYFDAILCWDVLGHMEEPEKVIKELVRILQPKGILIGSFFSSSEPCVLDSAMEKISDTDYRYKNDYFYRLYSKEMLESLFANFNNIVVREIQHTIWTEPPHEDFREYEHEHHSWAVTITKEEN